MNDELVVDDDHVLVIVKEDLVNPDCVVFASDKPQGVPITVLERYGSKFEVVDIPDPEPSFEELQAALDADEAQAEAEADAAREAQELADSKPAKTKTVRKGR